MGQRYSNLSIDERTQLSLLIQSGHKQCAMAEELGRSESTISREIKRHRSLKGCYLAATAHQQAKERRKHAKQGLRKLGKAFDTPLGKTVLHELQRALSPEQIAGRLKLMHPDDPTLQVSHETIYNAVYVVPRGELRSEIIGAMRRSRSKRMPRARGVKRTGNIPNLVHLSERPIEAESRAVAGHWEGDFIKGTRNASAIGTAVE
jgi:IS30 family transposase